MSECTAKKSIKHGLTLVNTLYGIQLCMGAKDLIVNKLRQSDLVINCGTSSSIKVKQFRSVPDSFNLSEINVQEIWLEQSNGTAPKLSRDTWQTIWNQARDQKFKRIVFTCTGGHGRSPTAMAAMMQSVGDCSYETALEHIRNQYCQYVPETKTQLEYLEAL